MDSVSSLLSLPLTSLFKINDQGSWSIEKFPFSLKKTSSTSYLGTNKKGLSKGLKDINDTAQFNVRRATRLALVMRGGQEIVV